MLTNRKRTHGARAAVIYVTVGALIVVWSGVWCLKLLNDPTRGDSALSWCYGFLLTGVTFVLIGLAIGWIGRGRRSDRAAAGPGENVSSAAPAEGRVAAPSRTIGVAHPSAAPGVGQDSDTSPYR